MSTVVGFTGELPIFYAGRRMRKLIDCGLAQEERFLQMVLVWDEKGFSIRLRLWRGEGVQEREDNVRILLQSPHIDLVLGHQIITVVEAVEPFTPSLPVDIVEFLEVIGMEDIFREESRLAQRIGLPAALEHFRSMPPSLDEMLAFFMQHKIPLHLGTLQEEVWNGRVEITPTMRAAKIEDIPTRRKRIERQNAVLERYRLLLALCFRHHRHECHCAEATEPFVLDALRKGEDDISVVILIAIALMNLAHQPHSIVALQLPPEKYATFCWENLKESAIVLAAEVEAKKTNGPRRTAQQLVEIAGKELRGWGHRMDVGTI